MWKLIDELEDLIRGQTTLIGSTKAELHEVKQEQNVLQEQNQKLHEKVKAPRAQLDSPPPAPSRSSAAVAASMDNMHPQPRYQHLDKD